MNATTQKTTNAAKTADSEPKTLEDVRNVMPITDRGDWSPSTVFTDENTADCKFSVSVGAKQLHEMRTVFDFSKCSRQEILGLALRACRIWVQRNWTDIAKHDIKAAVKPGTFASVDVKTDIIDAKRGGGQPATVALAKALEKMSAAEQAAFLEAKLAELKNGEGAAAK